MSDMELLDLLWFSAWYFILILPLLWVRRRVEFKRISIPLIRRIYPQLITETLTQVQPMLEPASLVHYLRYRYASTREQPTHSCWYVSFHGVTLAK